MSQAVIQAAVEEGLDLGEQKGEEDAYPHSGNRDVSDRPWLARLGTPCSC